MLPDPEPFFLRNDLSQKTKLLRSLNGMLRLVKKFKTGMKRSLVGVGISMALWALLGAARSWVIVPRCYQNPSLCLKEKILSIDQYSLGMEHAEADALSTFTQNLSGFLGFLVPLFWTLAEWIRRHCSKQLAWRRILGDLLLFTQASCWNGVGIEFFHLISQRPRPLVYLNPSLRGLTTASYTSFYSGHTSFVACMQVLLCWVLWERKMSSGFLLFFGLLGEGLLIATACLRVLAGRHFLTDVLVGACLGSCIAWILGRTQRFFQLV
jgi:membrane-associated phospholipid phosphatase